jgi:hypothetical protein
MAWKKRRLRAGPPAEPARLRSVRPAPVDAESTEPADLAALAVLTARLAEALRAVRGYVPHRIWWEAGPAEALIAYQATEGN